MRLTLLSRKISNRAITAHLVRMCIISYTMVSIKDMSYILLSYGFYTLVCLEYTMNTAIST